MSQPNNLFSALMAAQSELADVKHDSVNPHFKNKYASLKAIMAEIKRVFPKHGLYVRQFVKRDGDGAFVLVTSIEDEAGNTRVTDCPLLNPKGDMQGFGSALSYARRYSLSTIAGIVTEDDDDGEAAAISRPQKTVSPGINQNEELPDFQLDYLSEQKFPEKSKFPNRTFEDVIKNDPVKAEKYIQWIYQQEAQDWSKLAEFQKKFKNFYELVHQGQ